LNSINKGDDLMLELEQLKLEIETAKNRLEEMGASL
jgi:hypothetical protein